MLSPVKYKEFISDLIDEMESNLFLKDIVTKTRIDTLRQVLPESFDNRSLLDVTPLSDNG